MVDAQPPQPAARRMSATERREQIVQAATAVFGARGYGGTTTDDIARAAGVSQPYVVRLFGTKEALFLAALEDAVEHLVVTFRGVLEQEAGTAPVDVEQRYGTLGEAYVELLRVRGLHLLLSQAFLLGAHPVIGAAARHGFARIWRLLRDEAGLSGEEAHEFLAHGMLINTMLGLRVTEDYGRDDDMTELLDTCFPTKIHSVLAVAPRVAEPW
ncbi:TetR/AcrR family transcriptional regulator [Lapillicoccus jejuensis]|uniref:TetR family transcriptional regulator n=1 Tax=Lapillicoccus jejuensis TaxID=402171 RepID=A0A542E094_9MICO|nr:TetR/AcrR family transcriptional regulator [Lapillicoccus jejuensis]TQJ08772.1 TetR family transcriptional regulator [Lapillicoccus jejuensis]